MPENATPWLKVRIPQDAKLKRTEVLIYDRIGKEFWDESGITFKAFREAWDAIPPDHEIDLRVNSPGGSIWDGLPIHDLIAQRRDRVTAFVEGVAASIASVIPMAAKRIVMPARGEIFIHEPWTGAQGDAEVMRNAAERLEFLGEQIARIYAAKSGKTKEEMRSLMKAGGLGTSFFGVQAKEAGLVDEITSTEPMRNSFDLSRFRPAGFPTGGTTPPPVQSQQTDIMSAEIKTPVAEVTPTPTVTRNPEAPDLSADFARLRAELETERAKLQAAVNAERENRLSRELNSIAAEHEGVDPKIWLPRAMADESVIADLRKLPRRNTDAVGGSVTNMGNPLIEQFNTLKPGNRMAFLIENHRDLDREFKRMGPPRGDNTLASGLVPAYVAEGLIVKLTSMLAPLSAFTTSFSGDAARPRASVVVPKSKVGPTVLTNATNFEAGDSTVAGQAITINQYTAPFHLTNDQLQQGHLLSREVEMAAANLAITLTEVCTALMVAGTTDDNGYGAQALIDTAANFEVADMKLIYAAAKNFVTKNLILDGTYIAALAPTSSQSLDWRSTGAFGFNMIAENNTWTGATDTTVGFVCDPRAMVVASRVPLDTSASGRMLGSMTTALKNGLTVVTYEWFNTATRTSWMSHDICFGAQVGDGTAGKMLKGAAT